MHPDSHTFAGAPDHAAFFSASAWGVLLPRMVARGVSEKLRLMIVDDNPRTRGALVACLSTIDEMSVMAQASDGWEALDMLEVQAPVPDIVLMDVRMPKLGGLEATRIMKRRWPHLKVVILSMYPDYLIDATLAGADAFLAKGCSMDEVVGTIRALAAV